MKLPDWFKPAAILLLVLLIYGSTAFFQQRIYEESLSRQRELFDSQIEMLNLTSDTVSNILEGKILGGAYYGDGYYALYRFEREDSDVEDTRLHEIAHALVKSDMEHFCEGYRELRK